MIQPTLATVGQVLALSKQFVVPKYQRAYEWDKSAADEFLEDLQEEAKANRALFLGTLIFDTSQEASKKIIIVDGQQRLTTIFLLLIACRCRARALGEEGIAQQTQQRITFVDPATADSLGPLLLASESIKEIFQHMADGQWDGKFPAKIGAKQVKRQTNRVRPTYDLFQNYVKEFDKTQLASLLESIYKTRVIRIELQGEEEAFSIFERTNNRGVDLEVSDLLKNFFYQQGIPELDEIWNEIIRNSDGTILKMLKYFYVSRKGYVNKAALYRKLKEYSKEIKGPSNLVEELRKFSAFYAAIRKEEGSNVVKTYFDDLGCKAIASDADKYERIHISLQALRLFKISQIYPLIDAAIRSLLRNGGAGSAKDAKTFIRLLQSMEKYHFVNNAICDRVGNEVEKLYADYCTQYSKTSEFEKTTLELTEKLIKQLASETEFASRFAQLSYSPETIPIITYVFDRFSNEGLAPGERVSIFNPLKKLRRRGHNVEHFLAQKPTPGTVIDSETFEAIDNIGNLLVVSFRVNSSLGNGSPREKFQKLAAELDTKVANLRYVRDFIKQYSKFGDSWNKEVIVNRANDMAHDAYNRVWKLT
jgi:uncharacterized protein with ParB-like and HNH nuclease domain